MAPQSCLSKDAEKDKNLKSWEDYLHFMLLLKGKIIQTPHVFCFFFHCFSKDVMCLYSTLKCLLKSHSRFQLQI